MRLEKIVTITGINKAYPSRAIGSQDHHPSTTVNEAPDDRKQGSNLPRRKQASDDTATAQQPEEHSDTNPATEAEPRALDITA